MEPTAQQQLMYCRSCGKALTPAEQRLVRGTVYCAEHEPAAGPPPAPSPFPDSPWTAAATPGAAAGQGNGNGVSPGLAFFLGLFPGVGAIYNGQYAKGLVHVIIFGLLISIAGSDAAGEFQPLFGLLIPIWVIYMAFEAYHTAKRREQGLAVDEFSSLVSMEGAKAGPPVGPAMLILFGVLFLLNNLGMFRLSQLLRFWPVALIALGIYLLVERSRGANTAAPGNPEGGAQ
jgi:hypothetical protein